MFDGMPGGFPGGVPQNPEQMQQSMQQMMNNPVVQSLLDNPEFLHTMMQSNPAIRQVCCESVEWEGNWGGGYSLCLSMLLAPVSGNSCTEYRHAASAPHGCNVMTIVY